MSLALPAGVAPALQDLVAGRLDLQFAEVAGMLPHLRGGKLRAYAVLSDRRAPAAPEIPTIEEAGGPRLHVTTWRGVWAPKGTPGDVIAKINRAVVAALGDPALQRRAADVGQEIVPREQQMPQALAAHHRAEIEKWLPMVQAAICPAGLIGIADYLTYKEAQPGHLHAVDVSQRLGGLLGLRCAMSVQGRTASQTDVRSDVG